VLFIRTRKPSGATAELSVQFMSEKTYYPRPVLSGRRRWESSQSIEREWIRCDLRFFRFELRSAKKGLPEGEERRCENGE
jgi:hypothetical protein